MGFNLSKSALACLALSFFATSCARKADFSGTSSAAKKPPISAAATPKEPSHSEAADAAAGKTIEAIPNERCKKAQKILILDFKSGWWAGDGGTYFKSILGSMDDTHCNGAPVGIEYHHIVKGKIRTVSASPSDADWRPAIVDQIKTFPEGEETTREATFDTGPSGPFLEDSFDAYSQIWLLSGSKLDNVDVEIDNPFFAKVISMIVGSSANLFVGAGFGSISHANALTSALSLGEVFGTDLKVFSIIFPDDNKISTKTKLLAGTNFKAEDLFGDISFLPDQINYAEGTTSFKSLQSDFVQVGNVETVAKTDAGKTVVATAQIGQRKVVFEAGLQRFYAIKEEGAAGEISKYLNNIMVHLQ
jgi:hypothetical protein